MAFDPEKHLIDLRGRKYLETKYRLMWFRDEHPTGAVVTEVVNYDPLVVRATVRTGDGTILATGHGGANDTGKAVWSGRPVEKAETAAQGRALAAAGYGTQFALDADDDERDHLADSPVDRRAAQPKNQSAPAPKPAPQPAAHFMEDAGEVYKFVHWWEERFARDYQTVLPELGITRDNMPATVREACTEALRLVKASGSSTASTAVLAYEMTWTERGSEKYFTAETVLGVLRLYGHREEAAEKTKNDAMKTAKAGDKFKVAIAIGWEWEESKTERGQGYFKSTGWNSLAGVNQADMFAAEGAAELARHGL